MSKKDIIARSVYTFLEGAENAISAAKFRVQIRVVGANGGLAQIDFAGALSDVPASDTTPAPVEPGELSPEAPEAVPEAPLEAPPTFPQPAPAPSAPEAPAKRGRPRKAVEPAAPAVTPDAPAPSPVVEDATCPALPIPEDATPLPDRLAAIGTRDGVPPDFVTQFCIERDRLPKGATPDDLWANDAAISWALSCWGTIRDIHNMRQSAKQPK